MEDQGGTDETAIAEISVSSAAAITVTRPITAGGTARESGPWPDVGASYNWCRHSHLHICIWWSATQSTPSRDVGSKCLDRRWSQ